MPNSIYWTPQPAYDRHGNIHPFTPTNRPLLCVLDKERDVYLGQGVKVKERRNTGRIDVWTGREWLRGGQGAGRYHSLFPIPDRNAPIWEEGRRVPMIATHYLILCGFCHTCTGSYWRIEPDYYVARADKDEDQMIRWRVFRRENEREFKWAHIPSSAVLTWTDLPQIARPS
jgi:hypothetical protein